MRKSLISDVALSGGIRSRPRPRSWPYRRTKPSGMVGIPRFTSAARDGRGEGEWPWRGFCWRRHPLQVTWCPCSPSLARWWVAGTRCGSIPGKNTRTWPSRWGAITCMRLAQDFDDDDLEATFPKVSEGAVSPACWPACARSSSATGPGRRAT